MKIIHIFNFILLIGAGFSIPASASELKRVLVSIGYSDSSANTFFEKVGVGSYKYLPKTGTAAQNEIENTLLSLGYQKSSIESPFLTRWISKGQNQRQKLVFDVMNSNISCNDNPDQARSSRPYMFGCSQQKDHSREVTAFIRKNIFKYNVFMYIGHSRYGSGISYGDFNDRDSQIDLERLSRTSIEKNIKLELGIILACGSVGYYKNVFDPLYYSPPPKFIGVKSLDSYWSKDQIPLSRLLIEKITMEPDFIVTPPGQKPEKLAILPRPPGVPLQMELNFENVK